ncbi:MAG: YifB family Mg chelatase-like AAA ATPase [Rhodothermales bacterium]
MPGSSYSRINTGAISGSGAIPVTIETSVATGLPRHTVVGLPGTVVRECLDRILTAFRTGEWPFPKGILTINLAPADIPKHGSGFDLPVALGLLLATTGSDVTCRTGRTAFVGELALDGRLRAVRGILPIVKALRDDGMETVVVPAANAREAAFVTGIRVLGADHLETVWNWLHEGTGLDVHVPETMSRTPSWDVDFAQVLGQDSVVSAMTLAAAGGHNMIMIGPPGCGKTMLAERFRTILPSWSDEEALEASAMHSLKGLLRGKGILDGRPFRAPHHSVTRPGMLGGGNPLQPGEVSLAHAGVLFLDELPEYPRSVLEGLREPLECRSVVLSRVHGSVRFPAGFQLLAAMNPCPCGFLGDKIKACTCSYPMRMRYRSRISGPLLDRIDIHCQVRPVNPLHMTGARPSSSSGRIRRRVERAQARRMDRGQTCLNAHLPGREVLRQMSGDAQETLQDVMVRHNFSMRARERILRMARTDADLRDMDTVDAQAIAHAGRLRYLDEAQEP